MIRMVPNAVARRIALTGGIVAVLIAFGLLRDFTFNIGAGLIGLFTGLTYGLLAVGLVLVFRSSGFINFAHGDIGFFSAAVLITLVATLGWPYWVALPSAMFVGASLGALTEITVVRRLRRAPRLISMAATLLLGQFLLGAGLALNGRAFTGYLYPKPSGMPTFRIGGQLATQAHTGMLFLTPLLVGALILFLRKSRFGLAIRAAAANPDAASMAGIIPARMATLSWGLAGAIAAFTAAMWLPTRGIAVGQFGPSLLVRALAAAVIGRIDSLPIAFAAGAGLGILEQVVLFNTQGGGEIEAWIFVIVLVSLLLRSKRSPRSEDQGDWSAVKPWPSLPPAIARLRSVRVSGWAFAGASFIAALLSLTFWNVHSAFVLEITAAFILVGVSIGIVSGMAGQLSLGQFAIAGIGAVVAYQVARTTDSFPLAIVLGAIGGAVASALVGIPALRLRGLLLAVTSLSFAVAAQSWLFSRSWAFGGGVSVPRPNIFGLRVTTARGYYLVTLIVVTLGLLLARNVRRSSFGRTLIALRDNEDAARAFTIGATLRKLQAFAVAGALAGLGGALFAFSQQNLDPGSFESVSSIRAVAATMIGGIAVLVGPVPGALYLIALPRLLNLDFTEEAVHLFVAFFVILLFPNGITSIVRPLRDRIIARLSAGVPLDVGSADEPARITLTPREQAPEGARPLLVVEGVTKRYGGVTAVDHVSLVVNAGETLGLIGPNGAGKTTLFELISGFNATDEGTVTYDGHDVTNKGPEVRGRLGMIRSFQEAALFPTMTLLDTVRTAHERVEPSRLWRALIGVDPAERRREDRARELIALMGLDAFRDKNIGELSTGTRRLAEITCLLALEPRLLLLDEPAAGVAQRETEQLGALLDQVKRHLATTLIVIEHDIPLLSAISDRFIAMESGRVIAEGTPSEVRSNQQVIDSFLGGSIDAIARSGAPAEPAQPKRARASHTGKGGL